MSQDILKEFLHPKKKIRIFINLKFSTFLKIIIISVEVANVP